MSIIVSSAQVISAVNYYLSRFSCSSLDDNDKLSKFPAWPGKKNRYRLTEYLCKGQVSALVVRKK